MSFHNKIKMKQKLTLNIILLFFLSFIIYSCDSERINQTNFSTVQISKGETLVMEGRCNFCHTPEVNVENDLYGKILYGHPENEQIQQIPKVTIGSNQWMEFVANLGSTVWISGDTIVFSANITPDRETGIGKWSKSDFITTIRTGKHPGWKKELNKPMPWLDYAQLTNEQLTTIYAYLMSQQPVKNKVPEPLKIK